MPFSIQNYIDVNAIYQKAWSYAPTEDSVTSVKIFLWDRKEWILAGTVIGLLILKIVHYIRSRLPSPEPKKEPPIKTEVKPVVEMKSTVNMAELKISMPKVEPVPPNITLTFAIDVSGSMEAEGRANLVVSALDTLLQDAQNAVAQKNANIHFAVTTFNDKSSVFIPTTKISGDTQQTQAIKDKVSELPLDGGTDLLVGLEGGTTQLEAMVKANRQALHVLVVLTDGDVDNRGKQSADTQRLNAIRLRLASASAELFTIGIGKDHDPRLLRLMTVRGKDGLKGEYIDTASGQDTIGSAIARIYAYAISSIRDMELKVPGLDSKAWSVYPKRADGQSNVGSLSEGKTLTRYVEFHGDQLDAPLDLSQVKLLLTFTDPQGHKGQMELPLNPHHTLDPAIIKSSKKAASRA